MDIIAEIGSNFKDLDDCIESIKIAKQVGADAVKFQLASRRELYGDVVNGDSSKFDAQFISESWLPRLKQEADAHKIDFMCSAFSVRGYEVVDKYVNAHKIASSENTHMDILHFCNGTRKVTFVSVGSTTFEELELINRTMNNIVVMASEIEYPCLTPALEQIALLKRWFMDVGYSDHTTSIDRVPYLATKVFRADYYEKHFNPFGYKDTPDAGHSINTDQFRKMVKVLRDNKVSAYWDCPIERPTKRVIIATANIQKGDVFTTTNTGCFRLHNPDVYIDRDKIPAHKHDKILGRKAEISYLKGEPI